MDKRFMLLNNDISGQKFGLHLERTEFGMIGILSFHFTPESEFELLLTDEGGENYYTKSDANPFSFFLPASFSLNGTILVDIFSNGGLVASGVMTSGETRIDKVEKRAESTKSHLTNEEQEEDFLKLKKEASYYIEKAKSLYGENSIANKPQQLKPSNFKESQNFSQNKDGLVRKPTFFDKIRDDFDFLYSVGEADYLLSKKFKNSIWRRVNIGEEIYILGKIFAGRVTESNEHPSFVALAVPTTKESATINKPLGEGAKFYHANIYDTFGFCVLVENAVSGKVASKLI